MNRHQDETKRTTRLEARIAPGIYALVQRAAMIQGRSVSDFVVTAAQEAAESVIERSDIITLSREDQERFAVALLSSPAVNPALERAATAHRDLIEPS